ncbi:MAG: hypothetical protein ACI8RD_013420, partial [Bacillariaceae sp.]
MHQLYDFNPFNFSILHIKYLAVLFLYLSPKNAPPPEISLGRMVGQGGFCLVCKVEKIALNEVFDTSDETAKLRSDFAASVSEKQYVIKNLRTDLP